MHSAVLRLTSVLIVEDDVVMQRRLTEILLSIEPASEVTCVDTLLEGRKAVERQAYEMVLVDIGLPDGDGCDLITWLHEHREHDAVVVISAWGHEDLVLNALRAGAIGYLLKEREDIELALSLKSVQRGGALIDPAIAKRILSLVPSHDLTSSSGPSQVRLSDRELEVLRLISRGCSNREIAKLTTLSRLTVEGYTKNIYRKLAVSSRTAAVFEAKNLGLLR